MPYELPPDPRTERRARTTRWLSFAFAAILVALVAYLGYVGYEGSRQLTAAPAPTTDCRTPATFGWSYEAINYDLAADAELADEPDPERCLTRGAPAGDAVDASDGVPIAGWYVPAADGAGPTDPTVVLVHGWGSNKSNMLDRAALLHPTYNLVLIDLRNHGQSGSAPTTQGVREADDLEAALDWLESEKGPDRIALLGVSMGGATSLRVAARDERVDALIVESTHATLASAVQARLERAGYPLSVPGSWATLLGSLLRTGEDVTVADPVASIARLDGHPLLLVSAGADDSIGATDADEMRRAAEDAGSAVTLQVCPEAGHAGSPEVCPEAYPDWVLGFLERHLDPAG
jgi:pimeloyl-ACP methyl ester carboxylesterase